MSSSAIDNTDNITDASEELVTKQDAFLTPHLQGQLQQIVHLAEFTGDIQVIQGPRGSGKTSLAHLIKEKIPESEFAGLICLREDFTADILLVELLDALGAPVQESQQSGKSIVSLRKYVQQLHALERRKILVIDDAHFLDDSVFASIISVLQGAVDQSFGLHLILFSERGLVERFDALGFIDVSLHDVEMSAFSVKETGNFVQFLNKKGVCDLAASSVTINKIWKESKGWPGAIIDLAKNFSVYSQNERSDMLGRMPWVHVFTVLILCALLVWVTVLKGRSPSTDVGDMIDAMAEQISMPKNNQPQSLEGVVSLRAEEERLKKTNNFDSAAYPSKSSADELEPLKSERSADIALLADASSTADMQNIEEKVINNLEPRTEFEHQVIYQGEDESYGSGNSKAKLEALPKKTDSKASTTNAESALLAITPETSAQLKDGINNYITQSEKELLTMNADAYVLQVLAARPATPLLDFLRRQKNSHRLRVYRGFKQGKSWLVVTEGYYPSRELALNAIKRLPKEQSDAGSWVKRIDVVQTEIRAAKQR